MPPGEKRVRVRERQERVFKRRMERLMFSKKNKFPLELLVLKASCRGKSNGERSDSFLKLFVNVRR